MMARQGWVFVGVNMTPAEAELLDELARERGTSKAATVREILKAATVHLRERDDRGGHTCPDDVLQRWGTSSPDMKNPCRVCWPVAPSEFEKRAAMQYVTQNQTVSINGTDRMMVPWWAAWAEHQRREAEAAELARAQTEALSDALSDGSTRAERNRRIAPEFRLCCANTKAGARCKKRVFMKNRCAQHYRSNAEVID